MKHILILLASIALSTLCHSCSKDNDEPKLSNTYLIEPAKFGITLNGDYKDSITARTTTLGINQALQYAKEKRYTTVRFPKAIYPILSEWGIDRWQVPNVEKYPWLLEGIVVPSGLTLDLNDATFKIWPNDRYIYSVFFVNEAKDVVIKNGHIVGDRHEHTYKIYENSNSHEWGFGICLVQSENVKIENIKIEQMTGDAVVLAGFQKTDKPNKNIVVTNNELFDCRRQGISVVHAVDCELSHNKIYNIKGTDPQFGIDIEPEIAWNMVADHIKVHNNHIKDAKGAISSHSGTEHLIYENTVYGCIIAVYSKNVKIYSNKIINSYCEAYPTSENVEIYDNEKVREP